MLKSIPILLLATGQKEGLVSQFWNYDSVDYFSKEIRQSCFFAKSKCLFYQILSYLDNHNLWKEIFCYLNMNGFPHIQINNFWYILLQDLPAIFFYLLIAIVMHQIIQEYLLDRVNRKLHMSKVKHTKFNESGKKIFF